MSQPATSSRLTNSSVNINGATTATSTNFGLARIGVTGNSFDISSSSGTVTLGITGTGNVQLGNATSGAVSFPGTTTFTTLNSPAIGTNMSVGGNLTTGILTLGSTASTTNLYGTLDITDIEGPTGTSNLNIGRNITSGSITIGNTASNNTVTIGNNGAGPTGTVNVGVSAGTIAIGNGAVGNTIIIGNTGTDGVTGIVNLGVSTATLRIGTGGANITIGAATGSGSTRINNITVINGSTAGSNITIGGGSTGSSLLAIGNPGAGEVSIGGYTTRTGTVYVGTGGTGAVQVGSQTGPLLLSGSTTTFFSPLTLGAAPTTSTHLGGDASVPLVFNTNVNVTPSTTPYNEGTFTISTPGTWIVHYYISATSSNNPTGTVQIYSTATGVGNYLAGNSTAPFQQTTAGGTTGVIFAAGCFIAVITTAVTYDVFITLLTGNMQMTRANCYVNARRIG